MSHRSHHTIRGSRNERLGRNAPNWKRRHPGKSNWKQVPPIPGTHIYQDLYIAKTKPAANGYPDLEPGYAIFSSRMKAKRGCPEDALAFYHIPPPSMSHLLRNYGDIYHFHEIDKLPVRNPYRHLNREQDRRYQSLRHR